MDSQCYIIIDLMPLYVECLLSDETTAFVQDHLDHCINCKNLHEASLKDISVKEDTITNSMDKDAMFKKINRKLSTYQIIFVAISFFFAINTSLLNGSFEFLLWYPILGLLIYLFYEDLRIVCMLSFIPIFLWSIGENLVSFFNGGYAPGTSFTTFFIENIIGSTIISFIHLIFALMGAVVGLLILKIKSSNHNNI